jgi:hypothetical protein
MNRLITVIKNLSYLDYLIHDSAIYSYKVDVACYFLWIHGPSCDIEDFAFLAFGQLQRSAKMVAGRNSRVSTELTIAFSSTPTGQDSHGKAVRCSHS